MSLAVYLDKSIPTPIIFVVVVEGGGGAGVIGDGNAYSFIFSFEEFLKIWINFELHLGGRPLLSGSDDLY